MKIKRKGCVHLMKKIILSLILAGLLCGCSANNTKNNSGDTTKSTASGTYEDTSTGESTTKSGTTNVAQTDVQPDAVSAQNYNTEKVVWGPGRAENHQQPTDPVMLQGLYKRGI